MVYRSNPRISINLKRATLRKFQWLKWCFCDARFTRIQEFEFKFVLLVKGFKDEEQ